MRRLQWKKNGEKLEKIPAWQLTKVRNKTEVIAEARNNGHNSSFFIVNGSLSSQEFGVGTTISKIQKVESYSEVWYCER